MKPVLFAVVAFFVTSEAHADGVPLRDGRYRGAVLVLELTSDQRQVIDHFWSCHLENFKAMNMYTPYVFKLTSEQVHTLSVEVGFAPRVFQVYETRRGFNDAGPHWNLALRFSESEIEVPLDLLLPDGKAKEAHDVQGWIASNPCFPETGKE